jgi:hypothetical protein
MSRPNNGADLFLARPCFTKQIKFTFVAYDTILQTVYSALQIDGTDQQDDQGYHNKSKGQAPTGNDTIGPQPKIVYGCGQ